VRRFRSTLKFLMFVLRLIVAFVRERPLKLRPVGMYRGPLSVALTPAGEFLPAITGGDETPEEKKAREEAEAAAKKAEEEREAAEDETRKAEEEAEERKPKWEGEYDQPKAERAVENARRAEQAAKEEARKAKEEAAKLRQAQETEQETVKRERDESRAAAEQATTAANNLLINEAIRDAAGELDVPVKKHRRLLRLVERGEISIDDDRNVHGATEAVEDVLEEFPEFKAPTTPPKEEEEPEPLENPGGAPDRKRKPKEMTPEAVAKMADENPDEFNQLFEEGKIPQSALAGSKK
jgi:hypothetical protein